MWGKKKMLRFRLPPAGGTVSTYVLNWSVLCGLYGIDWEYLTNYKFYLN